MKLTQEQLAKAKAAKSVEELFALAKENGMGLTEEEAAKYFTEWHKEGELADEELDNVSGGCGDDTEQVGSKWFEFWCPFCNTKNRITVNFYKNGDSYWNGQDKDSCTCNAHIRVYHASFNADYSKDGKTVLVNAFAHS